jgi:hypothetical protein
MGECLVRIGCGFTERKDVMASCTRKGYCKAGYCSYRTGDYTPNVGIRREIFDKTSIAPPMTYCTDTSERNPTCSEDPEMKKLRQPSRAYRNEEVKLPPRKYYLSRPC